MGADFRVEEVPPLHWILEPDVDSFSRALKELSGKGCRHMDLIGRPHREMKEWASQEYLLDKHGGTDTTDRFLYQVIFLKGIMVEYELLINRYL